jgi:hypothetical protein
MKTSFRCTLVLCASLVALSASSVAFAQWGWTDKSGSRIFSDQGPTSDVPDKNIFKRPGGNRAQAKATEAAQVTAAAAEAGASAPAGTASAPKVAASAPKLSGKDAELEKAKKATEATEAAKKKVEADKLASDKAANCERAKKAKASYDSGVRISSTNAKGEREYLNDTDRAAETKRIEGIIAADCKLNY